MCLLPPSLFGIVVSLQRYSTFCSFSNFIYWYFTGTCFCWYRHGRWDMFYDLLFQLPSTCKEHVPGTVLYRFFPSQVESLFPLSFTSFPECNILTIPNLFPWSSVPADIPLFIFFSWSRRGGKLRLHFLPQLE